jgi:hypothetical protein
VVEMAGGGEAKETREGGRVEKRERESGAAHSWFAVASGLWEGLLHFAAVATNSCWSLYNGSSFWTVEGDDRPPETADEGPTTEQQQLLHPAVGELMFLGA